MLCVVLSGVVSLVACSSGAPKDTGVPAGAADVLPGEASAEPDAGSTSTTATACAPGFHDCGGTCADDTSIATCGTSCVPCLVGPEAEPRCDGKTCGKTCLPPYADCDGTPVNGCEANLLRDPENCGKCHGSCGGGTCVKGECEAAPLLAR